jgi:hypothetical protein
MRFVARDKKGATKTGIFINTIFAAIATLGYMALYPLIIPAFGLQNYVMIYVIAATQIIELYLISVLEACLQAQQPYFVGYGLLIGEICKVLLAYVLIMRLQLSLLGVILSISITFAIRIVFYFKKIFNELRSKITFSYIREWMKGSIYNVYNIIGDRIAAIIFLMLPIYGGNIATSYYQAAIPIANIITYSSFLAFALYPKILAENRIEDATTSLKMVLMFAIPMTTGVIVLPSSYLTILNPEGIYVPAEPVLIVLAVDSLILTISGIFSSVLFGIEKLDEKASIPFKQIAKSRLFIVFSLPYVHSMITLPTAFYILTNIAKNQPFLVAMYVTAINTVAHLAMFIVLYIIVQRTVKVMIPWKNIVKYVFSSAVMAAFLFIIQPPKTIVRTLALTAAGGIIYLALLMVIDKEARFLTKAVLREIKSKFKKK